MEKTWIGCAPRNFRHGRKNGTRPDVIVVHIVVGSLRSCDRTFLDPRLDVPRSAHYGIGRDGTVHHYVAEEDTAFHAGNVVAPEAELVKVTRAGVNPNHYSIGIEHEGQPEHPWTPAMFETSARLIAEIAGRWTIPIDRTHVIMHREIRASKTCPGFGVDIKRLVDRAAEIAGTAAPGGTAPPPPQRIAEGYPRDVTVTRTVRLRAGRPATSARIVSLLPVGTRMSVTALVAGEAVEGGGTWWCEVSQGSSFFWAGASDVVVP